MSRFKAMADRFLEDANFEPINILVWGPGDPGSDASTERIRAYRKRLQIKDEVANYFSRAEVHFSEDPEMVELARDVIGQLNKQALQAASADFIIMLDISRGADLELDYFVPKYNWFREKVHVFLPERYVNTGGLVREVFEFLREDQVEGYTNEEFNDCSLASTKAITATKSTALAKSLMRISQK